MAADWRFTKRAGGTEDSWELPPIRRGRRGGKGPHRKKEPRRDRQDNDGRDDTFNQRKKTDSLKGVVQRTPLQKCGFVIS